ncbi:MAG: hypothetical protein HZA91_17580 [Verrucomicrobia bacterium]|nr:hypothetical protein [Verrucomicrobiota bacterium]
MRRAAHRPINRRVFLQRAAGLAAAPMIIPASALGRKLRWDPVTERFDCEEANRMMWREPRPPWTV